MNSCDWAQVDSSTPYIFGINRYSINDGPGIRITIFLKGCPLRCVWCHNPEGISFEPEVLFSPGRCIHCDSCRKGLECPSKARERLGEQWMIEALMKEIRKEEIFFDKSGGGVTLCGGEPLIHKEFSLQLLEVCGRERIHRAVDTSLYVNEEVVRQVACQCELFLVDLKVMDDRLHRLYTGVSNERIISNIRVLSEMESDFRIRIPLIEGINADRENLLQTAQYLSSLVGWRNRIVHLLPYHDIGKGKHLRRGTPYNPHQYPMSEPSERRLIEADQLFRSYGIKVVIGG